jgi:hypothetical protein
VGRCPGSWRQDPGSRGADVINVGAFPLARSRRPRARRVQGRQADVVAVGLFGRRRPRMPPSNPDSYELRVCPQSERGDDTDVEAPRGRDSRSPAPAAPRPVRDATFGLTSALRIGPASAQPGRPVLLGAMFAARPAPAGVQSFCRGRANAWTIGEAGRETETAGADGCEVRPRPTRCPEPWSDALRAQRRRCTSSAGSPVIRTRVAPIGTRP